LYTNSVVEKIYGMADMFTLLMFRKSNKTINNNKTAKVLPEYSSGKRNPLYPIRAGSFVSIVLRNGPY
jgi:hypothetical protein